MAEGTQEKTERNQQLIVDYLKKDSNGDWVYSIAALVAKYGISSARINTILDANNVPKTRKKQ